MGKKPFIDKKSAKHFHVVHRSQKDPLINDSEAPDRVLQEVLPINQMKHKSQEEIERVKAKPQKLTQDEIDQRIGQAAQYGIFFDDGEYDYTQHLKPIGGTDSVFLEAPAKKEKPKTLNDSMFKDDDVHRDQKNPNLFQLPSNVLPSNIEMSVGVMNQTTGLDGGLQPDMDPRLREVLEALSDEEYVENDLDDDFFEALNADGEPYDPAEDEEYYDSEEEYEDYQVDGEEGEEINEDNYDWQAAFNKFKLSQNRRAGSDDGSDDFDRQTKQTGFSVSSSAMHRNTQLRLLDDRFEKIEEEYADDDDESEYDSNAEDLEERADFDAILDEFLEKYEIVGKKMQPKLEGETSAAKLDSMRQGLIKPSVAEEEKKEMERTTRQKLTQSALEPKLERPVQRQRETWDVQSVISTYSNLENHPSLINDKGPSKRIRIDPKTGMPVLVEVERKQKKQQQQQQAESDAEEDDEEEDEEDEEPLENKGAPRSKAETKEEKRARKQAIKDAKKESSRREKVHQIRI
ncbi:Low temperature viability protein-domain-containing protein [Mucor lusitanicus]|uniref:Low temperature viability protein-domain-containing protein n=1 Tax=Mucor circinelloides f. lusitanicus TaxID=29924 RepID=A0A8H4B7A3_MUCCL|nr:Low temperature viability protein-domain-containing protein [Mucor lusitanicus]